MILNRENRLTIDDFKFFLENFETRIIVDNTVEFKNHINSNYQFLLEQSRSGMAIYGMTTGFGSSSANRLNQNQSFKLQENLFRYHGCGVGENLPEQMCLAILLNRLNCLCKGYSGVSYELLKHLELMINHRIIPVIPAIGSVGASGDLTPLSYIAAAIAGERQVYFNGQKMQTIDVYHQLKIEPYIFKNREALAIMNGTSVLTTIAALTHLQIQKIYQGMADNAGILVAILNGHTTAYEELTHLRKEHEGQRNAAQHIRQWFLHDPSHVNHRDSIPVQDPYSLRCSPHILGVLYDSLQQTQKIIEDELNSISDNPIVDSDAKRILNGGHFIGTHIAYACDCLKIALATAINLTDRQVALMMDTKLYGISENLLLRQALGEQSSLHHGFKAMQITLSSLAAEIIKQSNPYSTCSRPTEAANQDVVSMGTSAARDLWQASKLARLCVAIQAMANKQAFDVLEDANIKRNYTSNLIQWMQKVSEHFPKLLEDRAMDQDILAVDLALMGARL